MSDERLRTMRKARQNKNRCLDIQKRLRSITGQTAKYYGEKKVSGRVTLSSGRNSKVVTNFSVVDIRRPVMAVVDSLDAGKRVFFTKKYGCAIVPEENLEIKVTGEFIPMERKNGVFEVPVDVIPVEGDELCAAEDEVEIDEDKQKELDKYEKMTEKELVHAVELRGIELRTRDRPSLIKQLRQNDAVADAEEATRNAARQDSEEPAVKTRRKRVPGEPTPEERKAHAENHLPYRSWCE